jgi:BASS family bile acid:Na+ symporter
MRWIPTLTLFVMMLSLGMTLRLEDFRRIASKPAAVTVGILGQLVLLPLVALPLALLLAPSPTQAIGLVLIAACPGGVISNVLSRLARGDVALSITLTAVSSMVCFATIPFVVGLALRAVAGDSTELVLGFGEMAMSLFGTTALPVLLGMLLLASRPALAARLHGPLLSGSTVVLLLLVLALAVQVTRSAEDLSLADLARGSLLPVVALVAITMSSGVLAARALHLDAATSRTLALEIGVQNFNLALVVGMTLLGEQRYAGPALIYLPVMLLAGGLVVASGHRSTPAPAEEALGRRMRKPVV